MNDLEKARLRMIRYRILKILDAGRPSAVGEGLIRDVLTDVDLGASANDVRRALQYLDDKGYVELKESKRKPWNGRLLPKGIDYLEDVDQEDAGIARPEVM